MSTVTMTRCADSRCSSRRGAAFPRPRRSRSRATTIALGLLALLLMLNGEIWLLQRTSGAPDELTVATCAVEAVDPGAGLQPACTQTTTNNVDKEML
jgi:hypothetical protein